MAGRLYIGTSGFAFKEWRGAFYPEGTKDTQLLAHYAGRLSSVEVNYTFRRHPEEATLERWRDQTPEGFRFALKAHQRITHTQRLRDADRAVAAFLDRARVLGDRLGPILFQCPPTLRFDRGLIESFLGYLPPVPAAFEFRHPSWEEARDLLVSQGAAWCDAETDEHAVETISPGPFAYLRLRKDGYTDEEMTAWAGRIGEAVAAGRDVYTYVKHEAAEAPGRAEQLRALVAGVSP